MIEKISIDSKYVDYYWKAKEFIKFGKDSEFGTGQVASGFTEGLCRSIYDMEKYNQEDHEGSDNARAFDAVIYENGKIKYIEIKNNLSLKNGISLNLKEQFDYLYFGLLEFNKDSYTVFIFKGDDVRNHYKTNKKVSTSLRVLKSKVKCTESTFKFNNDNLYKS